MHLFGQISGADYELDKEALVVCGEGAIHRLVRQPRLVAKIYHSPSSLRTEKVEQLMVARKPRRFGEPRRIAWPEDILINQSGVAVGHSMRWFGDADPIGVLLNAQTRIEEYSTATYKNLLSVARNLCILVEEVHATNQIVLVDFNDSNFLVQKNSSRVSGLDIDGAQVTATDGTVYPCTVTTDEYGAPEQRNVDLGSVLQKPSGDYFGLAVMLHRLMLNYHPFEGKWVGGGTPPHIGQRIEKNLLAQSEVESTGWLSWWRNKDSQILTPNYAVPNETLPTDFSALFDRAFVNGHRDPNARPTAREWAELIELLQNELTQCLSRPQHWYFAELDFCPWCRIKRESNLDFFPTPPRI